MSSIKNFHVNCIRDACQNISISSVVEIEIYFVKNLFLMKCRKFRQVTKLSSDEIILMSKIKNFNNLYIYNNNNNYTLFYISSNKFIILFFILLTFRYLELLAKVTNHVIKLPITWSFRSNLTWLTNLSNRIRLIIFWLHLMI